MRLGAAAVLKKLPQVERRAWMALFVRAIQVGEGAPRKVFFIQLFVELLSGYNQLNQAQSAGQNRFCDRMRRADTTHDRFRLPSIGIYGVRPRTLQ